MDAELIEGTGFVPAQASCDCCGSDDWNHGSAATVEITFRPCGDTMLVCQRCATTLLVFHLAVEHPVCNVCLEPSNHYVELGEP